MRYSSLLAGALGLGCVITLPSVAFASGYCDRLNVDFRATSVPATGLETLPASLVKQSAQPALSSYTPSSVMQVSEAEVSNPILAAGDRFYALHGGVRSADEAQVVTGPTLSYQWTAEPRAYLPEGPSFGDRGVYFSPLFIFPGSELDYAVGAIASESGQRRWVAKPGQYGQGSAPLVLPAPERNEKIIYGGGAEAIFALNEDGLVQWCTETGLPAGDPVADALGSLGSHLYGVNYQPQGDALIAIYGTGTLVAFDRRTGERLATYNLPGEPAPDESNINLSDAMKSSAEDAMRKQFVPDGYVLPEDFSLMDSLIAALLGGGGKVNNYFAIDPDSGALWVAATFDDGADGRVDGVSEQGALYRLDANRRGNRMSFSLHCAIPFDGGSASTPAIAPGGKHIYTSDSFGKVLAFDNECQQRWALDLQQQVVGSLAASSTDGNVYAATGSSVFRIQDNGASGALVWQADLSQAFYDGSLIRDALSNALPLEQFGLKMPVKFTTANLDLAGITENAVIMQGAVGIQVDPNNSLMFGPVSMAVIALDKRNGAVLNATPAREETVSVISISDAGEVYLANSPIRRTVLRGIAEQAVLLGDGYLVSSLVPTLTGGISRYGIDTDYRLAARDNACFAERRLAAWQQAKMSNAAIVAAPENALVTRMISSAETNLRNAFYNGEIGLLDFYRALSQIEDAGSLFGVQSVAKTRDKLISACQRLSD